MYDAKTKTFDAVYPLLSKNSIEEFLYAGLFVSIAILVVIWDYNREDDK
jgi:hypothetical protein